MFQSEMMAMVSQELETCFGLGLREKDYMGLVSFGTFILAVGLVFVINPQLFSDFCLWIEQMRTMENLVRPPRGLIVSAIVFFGLIGLSDFFKAGIRFWIAQSRRQVLADILSGAALTLFAYLIYLYGNYTIGWQMALAIEAVAVGLLVILYSIIRSVSLK
jgi:hypothetical protein